MKRAVLLVLVAALAAEGAAVKTVCASGCDYTTPQAAIDAASYGWIIELKAGETFSGAMQLKKKTGTPAYIVIRSSRAGELPGGVRVTPSDTAKMAKLQHTSYVVTVEKGANYYRLEGLEIAPTSGSFLYGLVILYEQNSSTSGPNENKVTDLAHHIIIDHCYIHGNTGQDGPRNGIYLNSGYTEITNSWISNVNDSNSESHGIVSWNGTGPYVLRNNHIEAASITTLFGGATPNIPGIRATNLTFLGNHYYRPWKWRIRNVTSTPTGTCMWDANGGEYARYTTPNPNTYWNCVSGTWTEIAAGEYPTLGYPTKNQFELKNASQVLADGNLIENTWQPTFGSQRGAAFLFNQVDNDGSSTNEPSAVVEWAVIQNSRVKNVVWGVSTGVMGTYQYRMHDVAVENNLFENLGAEPFSLGSGGWMQTSITTKFSYSQNTILSNSASGHGVTASMDLGGTFGQPFSEQVGFFGNIVSYQNYGFVDTGRSGGSLWNAVDNQWAMDRSFSKNVVVDSQNQRNSVNYEFPKVNLLTASDPPRSQQKACPSCAVGILAGGPWYWENGGANDVGFVDYAGGNYRLKSSSAYKSWGHMGQDAGADIDVVEWSTADAADGLNNPYLDFRIRSLSPASTSASLRYTAYDVNSCTTTVSGRPDFTSTVFESADGGGNRDRLMEIMDLSPGTRYFYRVVCAGSYRRGGVFLTTP